jgi:uncharacterized protein (TIGR03083 family)
MTDIRDLFLQALDATTPLLAEPALVARFDGPSALAEFSVRGLAGHLLRAMTSAEGYLDGPEPDAGPGTGTEVISAAAYYAAVIGAGTDIDDDLHRAVRQRGVEAASGPPGEFAAVWDSTADRLRARLASEPTGRLVQVYGDLVLTLDDYLITRLVELVVHADDLAVSLGVAPPPLPAATTGLAIATLVEVARCRHGDAAVLRGLTRRERDVVGALRVM